MRIREYDHNDLEFILQEMDGRYSKRRENKFKLVESSKAFYCYVAEEDSKVAGFIIMEDLGGNISPVSFVSSYEILATCVRKVNLESVPLHPIST